MILGNTRRCLKHTHNVLSTPRPLIAGHAWFWLCLREKEAISCRLGVSLQVRKVFVLHLLGIKITYFYPCFREWNYEWLSKTERNGRSWPRQREQSERETEQSNFEPKCCANSKARENVIVFLFLVVDAGKYAPIRGPRKFCAGKSVLETRVSVTVFTGVDFEISMYAFGQSEKRW